jgi:hypothetical protein
VRTRAEVLAGLQTARLEDREQLLARRARVRRRLEDDEVARLKALRDLARRREDDREVRLALARERRRQRDQDRRGVSQLVVVRRRREAAVADEPLELRVRNVLDVAVASVERVDDALHDVDEEHLAPGFRERVRERTPT